MASHGQYSLHYNSLPEGAIGPVVASFDLNGPPPEEAFSSKGGGRWKPLLFKFEMPENDKKGVKRTLTASSEQMKFIANSHGDAVQKGVYKYVVGVVSSKRKRVELYDAESGGIVFGLQPSRNTADDVAAVSAEMQGASAKARRDMLIDSFGSRKKQKMERSKAANIVDVKAVTAAASVAADLRDRASASKAADADGAGAGASAGTTTERKIAEGLDASRRAVLPAFNIHASSPENAYPVDTLLGGEAVIEGLSSTVNTLMKLLKDPSGLASEIDKVAHKNAYLKSMLAAVTAPPKGVLAGVVAAGQGEEDGAGGGLKKNVVRKKLRCLVLLKYLFALATADDRLRYVMPKPKPTEGGAEAGAAADGAEGSAAAAAPSEPIIPRLKFVPASVLSYMLSKFTEAHHEASMPGSSAASSVHADLLATTYHRTPELSSRLMAHIAVLALTVSDFAIPDIRPLAESVKETPVKLLHNFREVGCNYEPIRGTVPAGQDADMDDEDGQVAGGRPGIASYSVRLTVPLTFPKPKAGPKRR